MTPFAPGTLALDLDALDAHVTWLHEHGVRGIAPLGTKGEGPSLSLDERKTVIERLAGHPTRMALLPATGAMSLPETIDLSRFAVERGASGVLVAPPSYFRAERDGVVSALANVVPEMVEEARSAVAAGRWGDEEQARLSRLRDATQEVPERAALKALVADVAGVPRAAVRPPLAELEPGERATLLRRFEALAGVRRGSASPARLG